MILLNGGGMEIAKEPLWTCEIDSKARGSQRDSLPPTACKFENIEHFISPEALAEMKKVKIKHSTKRFQKWWGIASKATMCTHAYCSQHLRKRFGYFCFLHLRLFCNEISKQILKSAYCRCTHKLIYIYVSIYMDNETYGIYIYTSEPVENWDSVARFPSKNLCGTFSLVQK